ncbi:Aste57867_11109 [Aphanomyces stellatus]|uniref:Aste57867_11109 protein n=1 Tax=Aphanomyces stellatus TaxID=120398 RepID=A0A485KSK8_9STRA|nr:hypothetical protein As57867_011067 [Aphanomyces stellatus]VFT87976.1 Aste57867_11109 [Aphanomyces stellatus]
MEHGKLALKAAATHAKLTASVLMAPGWPIRLLQATLPLLILLCIFYKYKTIDIAMLVPVKEDARVPFMNAKRGILVPMFDGMLPIGISLIQELRRIGNRDLIQVYYCLGELSQASRRLLHRTDAYIEVIDVCRHYVARGNLTWRAAKEFQNFYIKPLALFHTRLDEVVLLDADDILFVDPAKLWDVPGYKEKGTIFFYDREINIPGFMNKQTPFEPNKHSTIMENTLQRMFRIFEFERFGLSQLHMPSAQVLKSLAFTNQSAHEQDSSIVVVDKRKHPKAMEVLWFLITDWRFRYPRYAGYSWGDKENFWLAYELSRSEYFFSPHGMAAAGALLEGDDNTACGEIAQYFPVANESVLLHINGNAFINPYTKINAINGYDHSIRGDKMDALLANLPYVVTMARPRSPTVIVQPNSSCPQECIYNWSPVNVTSAQREALAQRIRDSFSVAAALQTQTTKSNSVLVVLGVGLVAVYVAVRHVLLRVLPQT